MLAPEIHLPLIEARLLSCTENWLLLVPVQGVRDWGVHPDRQIKTVTPRQLMMRFLQLFYISKGTGFLRESSYICLYS